MSYDFTPMATEYCRCGHADYKHSLAVSPNYGYWKCRVKKCQCMKFKSNPPAEGSTGATMNTPATQEQWYLNAENDYHVVDLEGYTVANASTVKYARLIRATPELLVALKQALAALKIANIAGKSGFSMDVVRKAEALIAQAEGQP